MCKLQRISNKHNIKPFGLLSMRVIHRSLHIDKIHKNKINSYNNRKHAFLFSVTWLMHKRCSWSRVQFSDSDTK